ncbi:MAG TPA: hypothetical protein DCZ63_15265 [Geobacter sp.]|nr:hypothetical protein [Geobacter sp.]
MTPDQFSQLLAMLSKIIEKQYTITSATDWPMLVVLFGCFGTIIVALICFMWVDLGKRYDGQKTDDKDAHEAIDKTINTLKEDHEKVHAALWNSMKSCQDDCCPRGEKAR